MRALAKCLLSLTLLLGIPLTVHAQIEDPVGSDIDHAFPGSLLQFTELVPPATEEAAPASSPGEGSESAPDLFAPAPPELPSEDQPTPNGPLEDELLPEIPPEDVIIDSGAGHPYDIPIGESIGHDVAEVFSTNNWFRGGRWYSQKEFVMLLRATTPSTFVAIDSTAATEFFADTSVRATVYAVPVLDTKDTAFTYEAGTRLTWGKILGRDNVNRDHGVEFSYLGLFDYNAQAEIRPVLSDRFVQGIDTLLGSQEVDLLAAFFGAASEGFPSIVPVPGFRNARAQSIVYESDFNSFEANYRIGGRPVRDRLVMQPDGRWVRFATPSKIEALFAGVRYVRMHEDFTYTSEGGIDQVTGLPNDEAGFYHVGTENDLVGFQLGGELTEKRTNWVFGVRAKSGGFVNFAGRDSQVSTLVDDDNDVNTPLVFSTRDEELTAAQLAVLVETGVYASYYLRPNASIRVGYDFLFINGVAVASDKNNTSLRPEFPAFRVTQNAFYHGASIGFEKTW